MLESLFNKFADCRLSVKKVVFLVIESTTGWPSENDQIVHHQCQKYFALDIYFQNLRVQFSRTKIPCYLKIFIRKQTDFNQKFKEIIENILVLSLRNKICLGFHELKVR